MVIKAGKYLVQRFQVNSGLNCAPWLSVLPRLRQAELRNHLKGGFYRKYSFKNVVVLPCMHEKSTWVYVQMLY